MLFYTHITDMRRTLSIASTSKSSLTHTHCVLWVMHQWAPPCPIARTYCTHVLHALHYHTTHHATPWPVLPCSSGCGCLQLENTLSLRERRKDPWVPTESQNLLHQTRTRRKKQLGGGGRGHSKTRKSTDRNTKTYTEWWVNIAGTLSALITDQQYSGLPVMATSRQHTFSTRQHYV